MFQVQWFSDWPLMTRSRHLKLAVSDYFAAYIGIHVCLRDTHRKPGVQDQRKPRSLLTTGNIEAVR